MKAEEIRARLRESGIENDYVETKLLVEEICGEYSEDKSYDSPRLAEAIEKRCAHYPLQYIIGKWWFCRCEFEVNENCLVPRPDTELAVETAVKLLPQGASFADLCTGSGCIAISILDPRADTVADAYELYPKTLELARRNAAKNKVSDRFSGILGDVLSPNLLGDKKYAAIISNPPYIRTEVIDGLGAEVRQEPRAALDGGEDGLVFYRAIVNNFAKNLDDNGIFIFEIGYDQADDLRKIAALSGFSCEIKKDLGGCDRVAILRKTV